MTSRSSGTWRVCLRRCNPRCGTLESHRNGAARRQREVGAKLWLEALLGITLPNDYLHLLSDGVMLCKLISSLNEGWIPQIYESRNGEPVPYFQAKKNITFFLAAGEEELSLPAYVPDAPAMRQRSAIACAVGAAIDRLLARSLARPSDDAVACCSSRSIC